MSDDRAPYRAVVCITTCERPSYLRRYLPHFARFCANDQRFSLLVSLDGPDHETERFCAEWDVPLVGSERREGVGISKNRVLEAFPDFDYYFFLEDDVELTDGSVFPLHVELSRQSGIHHLSLFAPRRLRRRTGETVVGAHRILHGSVGSARFNFFTGTGLRQVGGWHPRFAEYRRWGHTEHSYRFFHAGLAPAPFNVAVDLTDACIWHFPPPVTQPSLLPADADGIVEIERELIASGLRQVPVATLSPYHVERAALAPPRRLASTLDANGRYPLVAGAERRHCRSDYQLWRYRVTSSAPRRARALLAAAWNWPANPRLRRSVREALGLPP
jgi:hypothetical protein